MKVIKSNPDGSQEEYEGVVASAGAANAGDLPALDAAGKLDISTMPSGVGEDSLSMTANEALSAGDFVYVTAFASDPAGGVSKADATTAAKKAHGYVKSAAASGAAVTVFFDDDNPALSGLTAGADYFLSATTAGAVTDTAPTATGTIVQRVGMAINATTLHCAIDTNPVIRL